MCCRLKYYRSQLSKGLPFDDGVDTNEPANDQQPENENVRVDETTSAMDGISLENGSSENADETSAQASAGNEMNAILRNEIRLLRSLVVCEDTMHIIKQKLAETLDYRTTLMKDKEIDFRVEFPYLFSNPELVCL